MLAYHHRHTIRLARHPAALAPVAALLLAGTAPAQQGGLPPPGTAAQAARDRALGNVFWDQVVRLDDTFTFAAFRFGPDFWTALQQASPTDPATPRLRGMLGNGLLFGVGRWDDVKTAVDPQEPARPAAARPLAFDPTQAQLVVDYGAATWQMRGQRLPDMLQRAMETGVLEHLQMVWFPYQPFDQILAGGALPRTMTLLVTAPALGGQLRFVWEKVGTLPAAPLGGAPPLGSAPAAAWAGGPPEMGLGSTSAAITELHAEREAAVIGFDCEGPGSAEGAVLDQEGAQVRQLELPPHGPTNWDYRTQEGAAVPPGAYTVALRKAYWAPEWVQIARAEARLPVPPEGPPMLPQPAQTRVTLQNMALVNDLLQIGVSCDNQTELSATVTDPQGRLVERLEPTHMQAPQPTQALFLWDGRDSDTGQPAPPGRYLLTVVGSRGGPQTASSAELRTWVEVPLQRTERLWRLRTRPFTMGELQVREPQFAEGRVAVAYELKVSGEVRVIVLREDGAPVKTLFEGKFAPGEARTVSWDGTDAAGQTVPDGAYVLTVEADAGYAGAVQHTAVQVTGGVVTVPPEG